MIVKKFILKDVRCFEGAQEFNIRPLTFLVGENSTGKSTVLGCMQVLGDFAGRDSIIDLNVVNPHFDFNAAPYQMGAYADIARKTGGRDGGRRSCFELGFEIQIEEKHTIQLLVTLIERKSGSEPTIQKIKIELEDVCVVYKVTNRDTKPSTETRVSDVCAPTKSFADNGKPVYTFKIADEESLFLSLDHFLFANSEKENNKELVELINLLENILDRGAGFYSKIREFIPPYTDLIFESFAPIRSRPMRTYDPVREVTDPGGRGMPMMLMNMYRSDKKGWKDMQEKLVNFGKASGLFSGIEIKRHGRSVSDPFQLQVKVKGSRTNIVDVGYGVSQILPVLVRIIKANNGINFLVQQPEVHLHPKAQAELVTLMIGINDKHKNSFIIETHSDAMINRARIEIMKKKLNPKDVSLIYLESAGNQVEVHNIEFDAQANMIGVPGSYRDFFLKEQDKLLGFGD